MSQTMLARQRSRIGFVFQRFNLWPHKTALQNITESPIQVLKRRRSEAGERARRFLATVSR